MKCNSNIMLSAISATIQDLQNLYNLLSNKDKFIDELDRNQSQLLIHVAENGINKIVQNKCKMVDAAQKNAAEKEAIIEAANYQIDQLQKFIAGK